MESIYLLVAKGQILYKVPMKSVLNCTILYPFS